MYLYVPYPHIFIFDNIYTYWLLKKLNNNKYTNYYRICNIGYNLNYQTVFS